MKRTITKEWLLDNGIKVEGNKIYHQSKRGNNLLQGSNIIAKHKYGGSKRYNLICWHDYDTDKNITILEHIIIYAWYNGQVSPNMDIDHIDGNSLNNDITNLREITRKENLNYRNGNGHNDKIYYGMHNIPNNEVDKLRMRYISYNDFANEQALYRKSLSKVYNELIKELKNIRQKYKEDREGLKYKTKEYIELRDKYLKDKKVIEDKVKINRLCFDNSVMECKFLKGELDKYKSKLISEHQI